MAAVTFSPPLLLAILLILTTASTTQCHGHKSQRHHTGGTRVPQKTAAAGASPPADTVHHAICHTTPHPVSCLLAVASHLGAVAGAKASAVSVQLLPPNVLSVALASLNGAESALSSLSPALSALSAPAASPAGASLRRGAAQDCQDLHAATLWSLSRSASLLAAPGESLPAVRAHLAAALANKATCLDGLAGASGPRVGGLLASLDDAYEHVSNSLALVARRGGGVSAAGFVDVMAKTIHNRRLLQDDGDDDDDGNGGDDDNDGGADNGGNTGQPAATVITVAKDGTGNFRTVGEAVAAAPNNSEARTVIRVKAGTYEENVEVLPYKKNIALVGEGRDTTVITGSRSAADDWTTFRSATFGNQINVSNCSTLKFQNQSMWKFYMSFICI